MSTIIVVDPGVKGAVAWCEDHALTDPARIHVTKMPPTRGDVIALFREISYNRVCICYHEKNPNYVASAGRSNMMEFGRMMERCECIAETMGMRVIEIPPKRWQNALGLGSSGRVSIPLGLSKEEQKRLKQQNDRAKRDWKNKLKGEAQRRFPQFRVTLDTADALLLLEVALIIERG